MFGFIKKVLDFFGVDQSEDNPSETAVETTDVSTKSKPLTPPRKRVQSKPKRLFLPNPGVLSNQRQSHLTNKENTQ